MKIAFPTRDNETLSRHFGKMTAMVVVELDGDEEVGREARDMAAMPACGDGHHGRPDFVVSVVNDCDVVIANGIGIPLADRIRSEGVDVILTQNSPDRGQRNWIRLVPVSHMRLKIGARIYTTQQW